MTSWLGGWRSALRLARREARRAKGRSVLVLAMIGLPVAALAFAAVSDATFRLTPAERADRLMGAAQTAVTWPSDGPVWQDPAELNISGPTGQASSLGEPDAAPPTDHRLLALLPAGSRVISDQAGTLLVRTAAGTGELRSRMLDLADPLAGGIYRQRSGRPPARADEVALTRPPPAAWASGWAARCGRPTAAEASAWWASWRTRRT